MKISQVSRLTGASPKAIRHYEEIGLLTDIQRQGSYRVYSNRHVNLVRLIRIAQSMGFRLSEMVACMEGGSSLSWTDVLAMMKQKQAEVSQQIESLSQINDQLLELIRELGGCLADEDEQIDLNDIDCGVFLSHFPNTT